MIVGSNRIIRNNTQEDLLIVELGQMILAGETRDLSLSYSMPEIARADSLIPMIAAGSVTVNDGIQDYGVAAAIRLLMNIDVPRVPDSTGYQYVHITGNPRDYDDKLVVHSSPRPLSPKTYTHYMGRGDNMDTSLHGEGPPFTITVTGTYGETEHHFLSDSTLYMRGAFFGWENAAWGTEVSCEMWASASQVYQAPAGNFLGVDQYGAIYLDMVSGMYSWASAPIPTPALNAHFQPDGWWDLNSTGTSLVPNTTQSGAYNLYVQDRQVARFIQKMQIYRNNYDLRSLESDDIEQVPPGYYFRIKVFNPEVHDEFVNGEYLTVSGCQPVRLWGTFFSYREDTLP